MNTRERIAAAIRRLAQTKPPAQLTFADVAREAGVHWTTVRRHIGTLERLRALASQAASSAGTDSADTRSRLLQAAARLAERKGFQSASLDEVAAEAGLTKGAIYWHFSSKHDLLVELLQETVRKQMRARPAEMSQIMAAEDRVQALADWLERELPGQHTPAAPAALFVECSVHPDPQVREKLRGMVREIIARVTELVSSFQARGDIAGLDPHVVSVYLQAVLNGLMLNWLIDPERVQPARWSRELAELILYGIAPRSRDEKMN